MYKFCCYFFCILLLPFAGMAQITLSVQVPPTGVMQKGQLWNLLLVSTANSTMYVNVQLVLLTTKDNQPVMTAVTKSVLVKKGSTQLNNNELSPIQYTYLSSIFNADRNPNGFLPIGNFQACYSVTLSAGEHTSDILAEECIPVEVQPLSPPLLNTPFDRDTILPQSPSFTWMPPVPLNLFSDLTYNIVIVKMLSGQSALQAIQQNIPVYTMGNVRDLYSVYPASSRALDTAQWYAWRVIANNNRQFAGQSEVWSFRTASDSTKKLKPEEQHSILLRKENEVMGTNLLLSNKLGLKYYSYSSEHVVVIKFIDSKGVVVKEMKSIVNYGDNFLKYTLDKSFRNGEVYTVMLTDEQNTVYKANFSIK